MIVGRLDHWRRRMPGEIWRRAFEALERLGPDAPEGKTALGDDGMYAHVMSYATRAPDAPDAVLESHRRMVDIQLTLAGGERIDWFPAETLEVKTPYADARDVQFYHRPPEAAPASADVAPGTFVVLFPEDAHMPQLVTARGDARVKKVVVKVPLESLREE